MPPEPQEATPVHLPPAPCLECLFLHAWGFPADCLMALNPLFDEQIASAPDHLLREDQLVQLDDPAEDARAGC